MMVAGMPMGKRCGTVGSGSIQCAQDREQTRPAHQGEPEKRHRNVFSLTSRKFGPYIATTFTRLSTMGTTLSLSIATETCRDSKVTEMISLKVLFTSTTVPSSPRSGPYRTSTRCPAHIDGHGPYGSPDSTTFCTARISCSGTASGPPPELTTDITPGIMRIGSLCVKLNLQKT